MTDTQQKSLQPNTDMQLQKNQMHVQTDVTWHLYLKIPAEREGKVNTCSDFGDTFQQEKNTDNYLLKKFCNYCENNGWLGRGPGVEQVYFEP